MESGTSGRGSVTSGRSSSCSSAGYLEPNSKCALAALARHGKRFVVVALRGQIWFAELSNQPSSEVCCYKPSRLMVLSCQLPIYHGLLSFFLCVFALFLRCFLLSIK